MNIASYFYREGEHKIWLFSKKMANITINKEGGFASFATIHGDYKTNISGKKLGTVSSYDNFEIGVNNITIRLTRQDTTLVYLVEAFNPKGISMTFDEFNQCFEEDGTPIGSRRIPSKSARKVA